MRDIAADARVYPCQCPPFTTCNHYCGEILAGVWWDVRLRIGLDAARQLFTAWTVLTLGGDGFDNLNTAHPGTAIEALVMDDDDGDLSNGTPHDCDICAAFAAHNIACPLPDCNENRLPTDAPSPTR